MLSDLRTAVDQARRHPWFFAGAALSLAIGMSVATAVFSIVDAVVLRPLPFHEPDRVVFVSETVMHSGGRLDMSGIPSRHIVAVRDARAFGDVAAWTYVSVALEGSGSAGDASASLSAARVTPNFFSLLGVRPAIGRDFVPADGRAGARAVMLSHALWHTRFGGDSAIVGTRIVLNDSTYRVAGVLDEKYGFPAVQLWLALPPEVIDSLARAERDNTPPGFAVIARLAPGATLEQASAEVEVLYARTYTGHPLRDARSSRAVPLAALVVGRLLDPLQFWSAVAIVIAILCAVNFATMSLARGMHRRGEIAVRAALGASTFRVVRLLVAESVLIAFTGGAAAVILGAWMLQFVERWFATSAAVIAPTISWPTVLFGLLATTVVGILFAVAPAVEMAKVDLRSRLQGDAAQTTSRRSELRGRRLLVGLQLTFALTAIAAVAALVEADRRHWSAATGIDETGLLIAQFASDSMVRQPAPVLLDRIRSAPGVRAAAVLGHVRGATAWTDDPGADAFATFTARVSPAYFDALGARVTHGRMPTPQEVGGDARVIVVSRSLAARAFVTDSNAVGKRLHLRVASRPREWYTVVGVVPDVGGTALWAIGAPIYVVDDRDVRAGTLVVRTAGDIGDRTRDLMAATAMLRPQVTLGGVRAARSLVDAELAERRGRARFGMSIGALALVLAVIGVYGLTSYDTEARARELGIRVALGASRARLANAVLGELWAMAAIGVLVALIAAAQVTGYIASRSVNPLADQPLLRLELIPALAAGVTLCVVLLLGTAVPVRRVLRLDVMKAIHSRSTS